MAQRGGLSNQLLGKMVDPKPEFGSVTDVNDANSRIWAGLKPNLSGHYFAIVDAAWTDEGNVKLAVHDCYGNTAEFYFKHVNLKLEVK